MIQLSIAEENIGATYSPSHYARYKEIKDLNYFEEIVDMLILDEYAKKAGLSESYKNAISNLSREKKRMAILILLDKDRNLYKNIKALMDKEINRMDHLRDVIVMLREYVKIGEVDVKKYGEVMTPLSFVEEILNALPKEVWSNPYLKWLDPANGTGPFPIMVIYRLMEGLAEWEPDEEKRYKHIVENMIYVAELQPKNMFLYMCAVDPFDAYKLNIYTGSFLDKERFEYHMKNVWGVERFDIDLGNPPYNKAISGDGTNSGSLYDEFVMRSMEIADRLLFVIPLKWANNSYKEFRSKILDFGIEKLITIKEGDSIFSTTGVGEICILSMVRGSKSLLISEIDRSFSHISDFAIDIDENEKVLQDGFIFVKSHLDIVRKIYSKSENFLNKSYKNPQLIKTNLLPKTSKIKAMGGIDYIVRKSRGEDVRLNLDIQDASVFESLRSDKHRVCFEKIYGGYRNNRFSNIDILSPGMLTAEGIAFFDFETKEEAENMKAYLNTSFCIFLRRIKQYDRSFTSMIFSYIPQMDMTKAWTDEALIKEFGLDSAESDLIRSYIQI